MGVSVWPKGGILKEEENNKSFHKALRLVSVKVLYVFPATGEATL
jgi:hypothetical protein